MLQSFRFDLCFLIALVLLSWFVRCAEACSCTGPRPPCEAYSTASAVFIGVVIAGSTVEEKVNDGERDYIFHSRVFRFAVKQVYKGVEGTEVDVTTGSGGGDCGYDFKNGERYLVYAYRSSEDKTLSTGICTRTRPLSKAKEDLEFLRGLPNAAPGGRIYGTAQQYLYSLKSRRYESAVPLSGVKILIEGQERRFEAIADSQGKYEIVGLPPGTYQVRAELPEHLGDQSTHEAEVADRGCAEVNFHITLDGRVSGKIVDAEGNPAPQLKVDLIPADPPAEKSAQHEDLWAYSDAEGRYEIKFVPPGRYLLGINLDTAPDPKRPYPRLYYPGVSELAEAGIIEIGNGSKLKGYNLTLLPRLTEHIIDGVVLWPDGRPAAGAIVFYMVSNHPASSLPSHERVSEKGHFSIKTLNGLRYFLYAQGDKGQHQYMHAEPIEISSSATGEVIRLIIIKPGDGFENFYRLKKKVQ